MSTAYARSDFNDENLHQRDGSLLRKKREQWAKEREDVDSWFPFGTPGGGAPNRKYEANSPVQPDKPENRPSSCRSNGDSGRWSDSENVGPSKEVQEPDNRHPDLAYPYMAASTSSAASAVYIPAPPQLPEGASFHGLPHIAAPATTFVSPTNAPIPVQLVCPPGAYTPAVPIPVELAQPQATPFPFMYPVRLLPSISASCSTSQGGLDEQRGDMSTLTSSYTEHWANQLPYWGTAGISKEDPLSPKDGAHVTFPSITGPQPLAVVRPMVIPVIASSRCGQQLSPTHQPGLDDTGQQSMSESSTSLNSSYRRANDSEIRGHAPLSEQIINEQIAEKQKAEARRLEEDRREAAKKENERRRMEEAERNKHEEEEQRKLDAEEERTRKEEAVYAAIEKAKREAEKLRKAKLYKHVLEDNDKSTELEHSILGFDDAKNVKILKEVESLERQKKFEMQIFGKKINGSPKKKPEGAKAVEHRSQSLSDERPVRGSNRLNQTYSEYPDEDEPIGLSRRGRQSLRLPSQSRPIQKQRSSSLERRLSESPNEPQKLPVRRPSLSCAIPVRPQRRIPPPTSRSRRPSVNESLSLAVESPQADMMDVISLDEYPMPVKPLEKHLETSPKEAAKKANSLEQCREYLFPAASTAGRLTYDVPELKPISTTIPRPTTTRRASSDALSFLSDIPTSDEKKTPFKRRTSHPIEDSFAQNPLFQPVATRCRRSRVPMENSDAIQTSPSSSTGSPAPTSQDDTSSPIPALKISSEDLSENEPPQVANKPSAERPMGLTNGMLASPKPLTNGNSSPGSAMFSPFRQKLANTNVLARHREDELLTPEIKRKGECPQPSSLRSSMANLSVDGSEDGRVSPASPLLQRFNSKTSQYRSLNLKKTSERNQKILEKLAELRSRLPQSSASTERDAFRQTFFSRSPRHLVMNETPRQSSESVTAV